MIKSKITYKSAMAKAEDISLELFLLCVIFFILVLSFYMSLCKDSFTPFARSGSIVVLIAAWIQARNYKVQQNIHLTSQKTTTFIGVHQTLKWELPKKRVIIERITLVILVVGTLTWSFGDLLG